MKLSSFWIVGAVAMLVVLALTVQAAPESAAAVARPAPVTPQNPIHPISPIPPPPTVAPDPTPAPAPGAREDDDSSPDIDSQAGAATCPIVTETETAPQPVKSHLTIDDLVSSIHSLNAPPSPTHHTMDEIGGL